MDRVKSEILIINLDKVSRLVDQKLELSTKVGYKFKNTFGRLLIRVLMLWFFQLSTYNLLN